MQNISSMNKVFGYRPDIDGLRAIAVLLVVVFHFDIVPWAKSGFIGVDVFFVISGYLITAILVRQLESGSFSLSAFYLHRVRRLAPALFAVLAMTMLAGWILLFPFALIDLAKQILASQFYVSNIFFWRSINYFGLQADDAYLLHTWSLSVEEQFYIVFPPIIVLMYRHCRSWFWSILLFACISSFSLNIWFVLSKPEATFYLLPTRAWELLAGGIFYAGASRFVGSRLRDELLGVIGLCLIAIAVVMLSEQTSFPGWFALLPVLGAGFVLVGGSSYPTAVSRLMGLSPLVYIGKISYALYLVHWPVNVFAKQILASDYTISMRVMMLLASIMLAMVVFHYVENPMRTGRFKISNGAWLARSYFVGVGLSLCAVFGVFFMQGFPQRFDAEVMRLASFVRDESYIPECEFSGQLLAHSKDFCRIGSKDAEPEWLVYGDSHAAAAYDGFNQWLVSQGKSGLFIFKSACLPIVGIHRLKDKGLCRSFNDAVVGFLKREKSIDSVLMVSSWHQPLEQGGLSPDGVSILSLDERIKSFNGSFGETVRLLHASGKKVFVWEPVPGARGSVPLEMARSQMSGHQVDLEFSIGEYVAEFDFFFRAVREHRHLIARTFSPSAVLCKNGMCAVAINGDPIYRDNAHLAASSSPLWAEMLRNQFGR